ncbi:alphaN-acetylglucosamine transferase, partial [Usnea florida]
SPYAYVFYATTAEYACSVTINIDRLNNIFHTKYRIIVLVKPTLGSEYLSNLTAQNATVIPYQPPQLYDHDQSYYTDVLLKLVGFRLHQYIPSLKRVLILDSDQVILQSLDHVFSLPAVDLAAPRAYWQGSPGFTSAFLLVNLSDRIWSRIEIALQNITHDTFDMDLLNEMFGATAMILPGDYCTLNSEWETNNIPKWWQGSEPPRDPSWKPSKKIRPRPDPRPIEIPLSLRVPLATNNTSNLTEADQILLSDDVKVMHYTALGKPWQKFVDDVKRERPDAHPLFAMGFELWRSKAAELC